MSKLDSKLVVQLINSDNGTRTKPFSVTVGELVNILKAKKNEFEQKVVEDSRDVSKDYVLVLMDEAVQKEDNKDVKSMEFSVCPLMTVDSFVSIFGE